MTTHFEPDAGVWHEIIEVPELSPLLRPYNHSRVLAVLDFVLHRIRKANKSNGVVLGLTASGIAGLYPVIGLRIENHLLEPSRDELNIEFTSMASDVVQSTTLHELISFWGDSLRDYDQLWMEIQQLNRPRINEKGDTAH